MRFRLVKEALVASLLFLFIAIAISYFPIKFEFTKPIKQDFEGFDIYDIKYSGKANFESGEKDTNIVIIQAGDSRQEIIDQIKKIESLQPAVLGCDVSFSGKKTDTLIDNELEELLTKSPITVPCYVLNEEKNNQLNISDQFLSNETY